MMEDGELEEGEVPEQLPGPDIEEGEIDMVDDFPTPRSPSRSWSRDKVKGTERSPTKRNRDNRKKSRTSRSRSPVRRTSMERNRKRSVSPSRKSSAERDRGRRSRSRSIERNRRRTRSRSPPRMERSRSTNKRGRTEREDDWNSRKDSTSKTRDGNSATELASSMAMPKEEPRETELEKMWKIIEGNANVEFSSWTKLLSCADNEKSIEEIRKAYDRFLSEYPLCYVYWKKFADHEISKGTEEMARMVYERGVTNGISHSVDLWTFYCGFVAEKSDNLDEIRSLFERGLALVGMDFASHPLWDQYIEFESSQEEHRRVGQIFLRILSIPLEPITTYWHRYKQFISEHTVEQIATDEEIAEMNTCFGSPTGANNDIEKRKKWLINKRQKIYEKTSEESDKRRGFESEVLKISYFHVRPLSQTHIANWQKYLTFEEEQGDHVRITKLYERCIIPCCNYIQFWNRYIQYAERHEREISIKNGTLEEFKADEACEIYSRCCNKFLKKNMEMLLEFTVFLEYYGKYDEAAKVFQNIIKTIAPGHVESTIRYVALERRRGNNERCQEIFRDAIKSTTEESYKVFLFIHYARFVALTATPAEARLAFEEAVSTYPHYKQLWHAYLSFEKRLGGDDLEQRVNAVYKKAVHGQGLSC
eukprot:TRINITY_DN4051_c0_g1_i25.p1 TRINITY_DN4051_c0_g1~~TRINITY_DN4051_c0_g1_i25.p1  ORF type:complete len:648 (-),score=93.68 TRINITY_DN4051_c0_g1_i25:774-2717(-)